MPPQAAPGTLPVLSGLRLELVGDRLTVTGTDLDLTIQLELAVGGEGDGGVVLPARLVQRHRPLAAAPARSRSPSTTTTSRSAAVDRSSACGRCRSTTTRGSPTPASSAVTLDAAAFGEALRQVVRAASTDEARPILTGVLLTAENDGLRLVATDSYRLAVRDLPGVSVLGADQKVLVPGRALNELQRLLGGGGELTLRLGERDATFEVGSTAADDAAHRGRVPQLSPAHPGQPSQHAHGRARAAARGHPSRQDPGPRRHAGAAADHVPTG